MLKNNSGCCVSYLHSGYVLVNYKKTIKCSCGDNNYQVNVWINNDNDSKLIAQCCYKCAINKIENKTENKIEEQIKLF